MFLEDITLWIEITDGIVSKELIMPSLKEKLDIQKTILEEVKRSYRNKITDEFFEPTNFNNYDGIYEGDGFFLTNFRADRVSEF